MPSVTALQRKTIGCLFPRRKNKSSNKGVQGTAHKVRCPLTPDVLPKMKHLAIAAAVIAIISGVLLKGTFGHWFIVMASGIYLGAPLAVFLGVWLIIGLKRDSGIPTGLMKTFFASLIVGGSLLLSLGTGTAIHYWEIREARNYVATMVPKLDQYRREHGEYPATLSALEESAPPKLLSDAHSYTANSNSFRFEYWDAARMMDGYYFDSTTRRWNYFD